MRTALDVEKAVMQEIAKHAPDMDPSAITLDSALTADLGFDSLELVELTMDLEDVFGITIADEERDGLLTVGQIVAFTRKKIQTPSSPGAQARSA